MACRSSHVADSPLRKPQGLLYGRPFLMVASLLTGEVRAAARGWHCVLCQGGVQRVVQQTQGSDGYKGWCSTQGNRMCPCPAPTNTNNQLAMLQ